MQWQVVMRLAGIYDGCASYSASMLEHASKLEAYTVRRCIRQCERIPVLPFTFRSFLPVRLGGYSGSGS